MTRAAALLGLLACGGPDASQADAGDPVVDAAHEDGGACPPADLAPEWLAGQNDEVIAVLSGARPLSPGVSLADRATAGRRDRVRQFLIDRLASFGLEPEIDDYGGGANVYVDIPPTTSATTTGLAVFGAHFDTVAGSPGANDNATGVAIALAVARAIGALPCRRGGVLVALFDQEEIGLLGSEAFAARLTAEGRAVHSVHTVDQQGWDADGDRAVELELPTDALLARYQAAASGLGIPLVATGTPSSDHQSFRAAGFAAVGITEEFVSGDTTPHYHEPTDTYATVDLEYLASGTRLSLAVIGGLAVEGDEMSR